MPVILVRYAGDEPTNEAIQAAFALEKVPYTYVVATAAIEDKRAALVPEWQIADRSPQLVFHRLLRLLIREPLLTRAEERVLLLRAAQAVAAEDPALAQLLRTDVMAWRDALAELEPVMHFET